MNQVPKFDAQEDEPPPPIPARSANSYTDAPSHTVQTDSQDQRTRAAPLLSSEVSAPVLPPKPSRMKLVGMIKCPLMILLHFVFVGLVMFQQHCPIQIWTETNCSF